MANVAEMEKVFNELLKKYEGAARIREWNNAARGVQLTQNMNALNTELKSFKKRFETAKTDA
ncbi:hypothetical protein M3Y14_34290 (plasmid) [Bacillus thuringiensis]|uniref:hypothetical protein n=1 Tax=Bacillus thuringiensis TaxID=1428 RepID=UPI002223F56E|nr:hypothetical protein [Bacillus thuringiensis]UYX56053.1 hypothetical protein M3Y14_34290 [Bacillus thuringiensis]